MNGYHIAFPANYILICRLELLYTLLGELKAVYFKWSFICNDHSYAYKLREYNFIAYVYLGFVYP